MQRLAIDHRAAPASLHTDFVHESFERGLIGHMLSISAFIRNVRYWAIADVRQANARMSGDGGKRTLRAERLCDSMVE